VTAKAPGAGTPTGNVTVRAGTNSCSASVAAGQCSLTFDTLGTKQIRAIYSGDANFNRSTSSQEPHTVTPPATKTATPTRTRTPPPGLAIVINEIAWSGTSAADTDEWIELYNNTNAPVSLAGWSLRAADFEPNITLTGIIPARGYYLLERTDDNTVSNIKADQIYTGDLEDTGENLYLRNSAGFFVDSANAISFTWLAGTSSNHRSMERRGPIVDSRTAWVTNNGVYRNGKDANGDPINGTPKSKNWAATVTLTPSRKPTIIPSRTSPPQPRPVINEFLPRAAFDWNKDGRVDVFDEFIEVANLGPVDINLQGWKLDDAANGGSDPFPLPSQVLKPGERLLLYGLRTNILLSDGGDTVRLLNPSGVIYDSQTYPVIKVADQSWCRLPDERGSWYSDCFPTPNQENERAGELPAPPPGTGLEEPLCLLADTLPEEFILAECRPFGDEMWSASYWDKNGWNGDLPVLQDGSKWETFVE
jgi:hypothetical protein